MKGFTDIHSHFLYGIDDGAGSAAEMEAMLDAAYADGITSLFATPHVTPGIYPIESGLFARRLEEAWAYCRMKKYRMDLRLGAEILFTPAMEQIIREKRLPVMADTEYVLVEFVPDIRYSEMRSALDMLEKAGYSTIIAHMERYDCLKWGRSAVSVKENYDVRYQVNCRSILESKGFFVDRFLNKCLKMELIDYVAADAHDCRKRPFRMSKTFSVLSQKVGRGYAERLTGAKNL